MNSSPVSKKDLITIRVGLPEDRNFILATWLKGLYYGDTWFKEIPKDIFMAEYHKILENILESPSVIVIVACLKEDPNVILGYAVQDLNETTLHWVFVKKHWRKIGLAKDIVSKKVNRVTHLTRLGLSIIKTRPGIVFNPF